MHTPWMRITRSIPRAGRGSDKLLAGCFVDRTAREVIALRQLSTDAGSGAVALVRTTVRSLGCAEGGTFAALVKKAAGQQLSFLPDDTAVHLCGCWDWRSRPPSEITWVVSKPISTGSGAHCLLGVGRVYSGWLRSRPVTQSTFFLPEEVLVFGINAAARLHSLVQRV